jgi:hypothetical protein
MKSAYIFLIMAGVIALLIWRLSVVNQKLDSSNSVLSEKSDSIRYFRSESGKQVAVKSVAEITKADLKSHYQDLAADLQDMKIKLNSVRAVLKAVVEAKGEGTVKIVRDTIFAPGYVPFIQDSVFINDSYLSLKAQIIPGTNDSYLSYKYVYQDSIVMAISEKKKWLFGKKTLYGSVRMSNPNARATNQTSILIKQRDRRFNLSIGISYLPFDNSFSPGVNIGYSLFRF